MPYLAMIGGQFTLVDSDHPGAQFVGDVSASQLLNQNAQAALSKKTKTTVPQPDVFIRKASTKRPGFNIASIMRSKTVNGDVGLEIEVEGNKFPKSNGSMATQPPGYDKIPPMWSYHHDGSLRGKDNAEYVLKAPIKFEEVPNAINALWDMFSKFGSKLDDSNRTSVHVHLNAQKWHLNRLTAFCALYFSLEELLTEWCGDHRVGNLFCLRAKDAPAIISKLKQFIQHNGEYPLSEGLHYSGLNVYALIKFGSLEVRALRGCTDAQTILDWVSILERLYRISGEYKDPRGICDNFSGEGPMAFLSTVLGDKAQLVKDGINWDHQKIMASLYEGIRLAQDLCYCRDWSEYVPMEVTPDPFDRDIKKVAQSLTNEAMYAQAMLPAATPWPTTNDVNSVQAFWAGAPQQLTPIPLPDELDGEDTDVDWPDFNEDYDEDE